MRHAATLYAPTASDRRRSERRDAARPSTLRAEDGAAHDIVVLNVSQHGFACQTTLVLEEGDPVMLGLGGLGRTDAVVRWRADGRLGCEFASPLSQDQMLAAFREGIVVGGRFQAEPSLEAPPRRDGHRVSTRSRYLPGLVWIAAIIVVMAAIWSYLAEKGLAPGVGGVPH